MLILCEDPGTKNFARTFLSSEIRKDRLRFSVINTILIKGAVNDLKGEINIKISDYAKELTKHVKANGSPDFYAAERFMTRGIKGATIEMVSMMLGINVIVLNKIPTRFWPAVSWKSQVKRYFDLDELYAILKQYDVPPHILDSALIGVYTAFSTSGIKPFSTFSWKQMAKLLEELICCYVPEEKKRKGRNCK